MGFAGLGLQQLLPLAQNDEEPHQHGLQILLEGPEAMLLLAEILQQAMPTHYED